jgi:hypothetical protein
VRIGGHAVAAGSHREFAMASGEMSEAEFRSLLADTLGAAVRVSRDGAVHFICMDWRHIDDVSAVGSSICGERLNLCIWNKSNAGPKHPLANRKFKRAEPQLPVNYGAIHVC